MQNLLKNKFIQSLKSIKSVSVIALTALTLTVSLLAPVTTLAQVVPTGTESTNTTISVVNKLGCKQYAMMIKNLMMKIKLMMETKTQYYETQIALLYTQAETAFLAGDIDAYDAIITQITALETLYIQVMNAYNQAYATLNLALIEASKNPCNLQLVKELIKKALAQFAEAKILCNKLTLALAALR